MTASTGVSVGREIRHEFGWLWSRTRRLAMLLHHPRILLAAVEIAETLDRYAAIQQVDSATVELGDARFIRGLRYIEYPLSHR